MSVVPLGTMSSLAVFVFTIRRRWTAVFSKQRHVRDYTEVHEHDYLGDREMNSALSESFPSITVVVPAYLPNEKDIIEETITHILNKLEWPSDLTLHVVYNTPEPIPDVESRLHMLSQGSNLPRGRALKVTHVPGSTSKAENLNAALEHVQTQQVAIYDADHHPDPRSLQILYAKLITNKLACAQGSVYIRNLDHGSWLGHFVNLEFTATWVLEQLQMAYVSGSAWFCGSNAVWNRDCLIGKSFDKLAQTEDIDLSFGALQGNQRIEFCPEAASGELAPVSIEAFCRQRLRWAVGWEQVTMKYSRVATRAMFAPQGGQTDLGFWSRAGIFFVLFIRYPLDIANMTSFVMAPLLAAHFHQATHQASLSDWDARLMQATKVSTIVFVIVVSCFMMEMFIHAVKSKCYVQVFLTPIYVLTAFPILMLLKISMMVISWFKLLTGRVSAWYVSPRE